MALIMKLRPSTATGRSEPRPARALTEVVGHDLPGAVGLLAGDAVARLHAALKRHRRTILAAILAVRIAIGAGRPEDAGIAGFRIAPFDDLAVAGLVQPHLGGV